MGWTYCTRNTESVTEFWGCTQQRLAERIGKSWSFISQVEANNGAIVKGISLDTLFSVLDVLEVPVSKFLEEI